MKALTASLLALTNQSYDKYNEILPEIKSKLGDSASIFEKTLVEELPLTTARRAYRTAICLALDETEGFCREYKPREDKNEQKG